MLMTLLLVVVSFTSRIGGLSCAPLVVILVIMLTLLKLGSLLKINAWLLLSVSLVIQAPSWFFCTQECADQWSQGLFLLASITASQPLAIYAVLVHGCTSK